MMATNFAHEKTAKPKITKEKVTAMNDDIHIVRENEESDAYEIIIHRFSLDEIKALIDEDED